MKLLNISTDEKDKLNRARIFWKSLTVIFFLATVALGIMWKIEAYGRSMDAKIIKLETEKALTAPQSNAKATSTPETINTSAAPKKAVSVSLK